MSREIKFRVWAGSEIHYLPNNTLFPKENSLSGRWEIMQFTGLKDKNGKEIYEGDIVSSNGEYYQIEFIAPSFGCKKGKLFINYSTSWEVVGNIYENPELLTN